MNYLIFRNDGIGDLIVSTCGINQLRKKDNKSNIILICSNRNIEYAKILKNDGHIDQLYNLDNYETFSETLCIISVLRKITFDHVFILKSDWKNLVISFFCKSKNIHAINPNKVSKLSKDIKYKYPLFLSNKIFKSIEIINSIELNTSDVKTKMGTHYRELFNKALNIKKTKLEYIKPDSLTKFESQIKKNFSSLKIKKQKAVLLHLDEKWNNINISKDFIINLIEAITTKKNKSIKLIVTNGKHSNTINDEIWNYYSIKKFKNKKNIYQSQRNKQVIFIKKCNISELIGIVSNVSLIFHIHGSITHITSILKTPIVDIIKNHSSKYFYKWRPNFREYAQIEIQNLKSPQKYINKYL